MDLEIDGNAALLTASSSGLGKASAKALAREGVNVVVNGRDEERLADAVAEIEAIADSQVVGQPADLTDPDDIEMLVDRAIDEFGRLDHLVTSAGGPEPMRPLEPSDEDWYHAFDQLVMSVVRTVRSAEPHLRDGDGGTIVMITSRVLKEASEQNVLSSAVRMALAGYQKTLSTELAPTIRTNTVLPGTHETPRLYDFSEDIRDQVIERIPLGRPGDPMELGDMVAYLSSPVSGFTNGQAVVVDGGAGASTL